jgi:hypothetical protein
MLEKLEKLFLGNYFLMKNLNEESGGFFLNLPVGI